MNLSELNTPLIGLIVRLVALVFYIYVFVLQLIANNAPNDGLRGVRITLTLLISTTIVFSMPGIAYLFIRAEGGESDILRSITTITTNISILTTAILFVLLYVQKVTLKRGK